VHIPPLLTYSVALQFL